MHFTLEYSLFTTVVFISAVLSLFFTPKIFARFGFSLSAVGFMIWLGFGQLVFAIGFALKVKMIIHFLRSVYSWSLIRALKETKNCALFVGKNCITIDKHKILISPLFQAYFYNPSHSNSWSFKRKIVSRTSFVSKEKLIEDDKVEKSRTAATCECVIWNKSHKN